MAFYRGLQAITSKGTVILCTAALGSFFLGAGGLLVVEQALIARAGGWTAEAASTQRVLLTLALAGAAGFVPMLGLILWANANQRKERHYSSQMQRALAAGEFRIRTILDHAMDAVIVMDTQGLILLWSKQAETIFGWPAEEVMGKSLAGCIVPPRYREAHNQGLARFLVTGEGAVLNTRVEISAVRKDGAEFPVELTVTPVRVEQGVIFSAFLRDITERTRTEQQMKAQCVVTKTLTRDCRMEEMATALLEAIGTSLRWAVGVWWEPEAGANHLRCRATWAADPAASAVFLEATGRIRFQAGTGLPGRVWQSGQPAWVSDVLVDENFLRVSAAAAAGLHGALAIPISVGTQSAGVLEFFATTVQGPDDTLLDVMKWIGTQIGAFFEKRQAEDALRDSEAQLRAVVEDAADGIMTMDEEGLMLSLNSAAEQIFGYRAGEVVGRHVSLLMPELSAAGQEGDAAVSLRTGPVNVIVRGREAVGRRRDGSAFPLELAISEMRLGTRRCFTGIVRDITERKQTDQAVRETEARFRAIVTGALDAIVVMDADGVIVGWNRRAVETFGWSEEDALGRDLSQTIVPPALREAHRAGLAKYLATGVGPVLNQMIEITAVRKDGTEFPVELTITPLQLESGVMFSAFLRDITARKRMVAQLNERETFFRLLSEQLPIGVFEISAAGECVYKNRMWDIIFRRHREQVWAQTIVELPPGHWTDWFYAEDRAALEQAWAEATSSLRPIQQECRMAGGGGEQWAQVLLWPMTSDRGIRYLGTIEDITVRKQTIAHTMQLLREGRFELQTPTEARNLAELLAYALPDPMRMQLGLMELLVNGVEHGNLEISYEEKSALLAQGLLEEELARRLASPEHAAKRVHVTIERADTELRLTIADEGKGFDWKPYLDLDGRRREDSHGRGIAMSKQVSFDRLEYRGCGNQVVVSVALNRTDADSGLPDKQQAA